MADVIDFAAAKLARERKARARDAFVELSVPGSAAPEEAEFRAVANSVAGEVHAARDAAQTQRKAGEQCPDVDLSDRAAVIRAIRDALRQRSGKAWSVTGGRGTAYSWLHISSPPARRVNGGMTAEDRVELAKLLAESDVPHQYVSVPSSRDYRAEYVARARGLVPEVVGKPYWD